ncbi:MAG: hypothetical protein IT351_00950, partial [Candidatus Fermentibacter sp.]|nr:hypothetical protein [Candidatus Fermentibacter sp.]
MTRGAVVWTLARHAFLIVGGLIMLLPFVWMVTTSLEQGGLRNYADAWNEVP